MPWAPGRTGISHRRQRLNDNSPHDRLLDDAALKQANRFYPAALASNDVGTPAPALPEFYAVGEFITRRILQTMNGEMPAKAALDTAATETTEFLKGHGYYK